MNSNMKDNVLVTALTVVQRYPRKTVTFSSSFVSNGMPWMLNLQNTPAVLHEYFKPLDRDRHTPGEVRVKENMRHEFTIIFFDVSLFHNVLLLLLWISIPLPDPSSNYEMYKYVQKQARFLSESRSPLQTQTQQCLKLNTPCICSPYPRISSVQKWIPVIGVDFSHSK